ncbi:putative amidohydrolase [Sporomusaceae bacterium BoRhaA]|uniref:metallo-dependent hydrolase n=1 Tax=Pelorhabdus rhamnosifermentans TaxID=2772457 RepID=UPI001C0613BC|nr:metallo-dependent hydrolase [Pelorhabdus rhamnosifermentans]MBU2703966.1 putative amidohydrolase [Pelorhabdus rhamnosifermentans]
MTIRGDLLIHGGNVIDPGRDFSGKADVLIQGNRIVDVPQGETVEAEKVIDATGYLVLPGLIDYHTHVFYSGTAIGVHPDSALLPQGVTTAIDQGSAGVTNFDSFIKTVVNHSQVRIFAHLHASPAGLATLTRCLEPVDPKMFDLESMRSLFEKYDRQLVGLKIRQSREIVGEWGLAPLEATVQMADKLGSKVRVVVHTTNPPGAVEDLVSLLRSGDVFTHVYQGKGNNILTNDGKKVCKAIQDARSRGVLFDTADGRGHYAFSVARAALANGFEPDIISTDLVRGSLFERSVFGLPLIMSKYLSLGISLQNVIKACTSTPASLIGMNGKIGTLASNAYADIAVFQLKEMPLLLQDVFGEVITCSQVFVPRMTVVNGRVVYRSLEF